MDFFAIGKVEMVSNAFFHATKDSLKATIVVSFKELKRAIIEKACGRFRGRVIEIIEAGRDYTT